jgi:hypothetical protein
VCLYDWRGKQRLAADEVFEAPRAAFTNAAQAVWEKSYDIKAKKPLNKFLKERMGGNKPSDDSKKWSYTDHVATDVTKEEAKLIQGYASVMKMCESRFNATNDFRDEVAYKSVTNAREAYATSWKPKARMSGVPRPYLEQAVTDLHALAALGKKGRTAYMAKDANDFKNSRLPLMREFLRYYDMTMTPGGPYKDIRMVATDRAPYRTTGGYGAVNYHTRNPYAFGDKPVVDVFSYDKKTKKLTIGSERSEGALFTRMTKMRPYRHCPMITHDDNSSVEYDTDGGSGWSRRSYGSQSFSLTPVLLRNPGGYLKRNPDPDSYATSNQEGWRWNVTDWETRKSAPYRYATMVSIPNGEDLQRIYTGGTADATSERYPSAQGGKVLSRNEIVDTINFCTPLLDAALKQQAYIRVTQERKEEKVRALTVKNQAATDLEMVSSQMVDLLKAQVAAARHAGVSDVEIYETLEMTQYDLELMVQDWEPSDYMAESGFGRNHRGS